MRPYRRLDPLRFKNELAAEIDEIPKFFGLCSRNEAAPVVPLVGDDAMTEWDIVCRGLDTLRKEEIRALVSVLLPLPVLMLVPLQLTACLMRTGLEIMQLAKDEELQRRKEEEARLAAEEADRAAAAVRTLSTAVRVHNHCTLASWCAQEAARQEQLERQEEEFAKAQDERELMAEKDEIAAKKRKKKKANKKREKQKSFSNPVSFEDD